MLDYYPFGKILREYVSGNAEKFLTTFHERDRETNLDYRGARYYDSDYGRFLSVDPLAADYAGWSPYNYVLGNPVVFIDPSGASIETDYYSQDGKLLLRTNDGSTDVVIINKNNIDGFFAQKALRPAEWLHSNNSRRILGNYGQAYDIAAFEKFYDDKITDYIKEEEVPMVFGQNKWTESDGSSAKLAYEHASFLYEKCGVITVGPENIKGDTPHTIPKENLIPSLDGSKGTIHTHPTQGRGLLFTVPYQGKPSHPLKNKAEGDPSAFDLSYHLPQEGYYSVIATGSDLVFFDSKTTIKIPRRN